MRYLIPVILLSPGCAVVDNSLMPALQMAWPEVRDMVLDGDGRDHIEYELDHLDQAILTGDLLAIESSNWSLLEPWAVSGVQWRIENGDVSEGRATDLFEAIINFREMLDGADRVQFPYSGRHDFVRELLGIPTRDSYLMWTHDEYLARMARIRRRDVAAMRYRLSIRKEAKTWIY